MISKKVKKIFLLFLILILTVILFYKSIYFSKVKSFYLQTKNANISVIEKSENCSIGIYNYTELHAINISYIKLIFCTNVKIEKIKYLKQNNTFFVILYGILTNYTFIVNLTAEVSNVKRIYVLVKNDKNSTYII